MSLKKLLKGKKTYIVAAGSVVGAAWGAYTGQLSMADAIQIAVPAILSATMRHGISTSRPG